MVVEPTISLAAGAEDNELATWVAERLWAALCHRWVERDFVAVRAAACMVAPDRRLAITLRFDHGMLTIHDGMIGVPDVTLCGDHSVLLGLADLPLGRFTRLPAPGLWSTGPQAVAWRRSALELVTGELKIYGLFAHPRLVTRLLRLLAAGRQPASR